MDNVPKGGKTIGGRKKIRGKVQLLRMQATKNRRNLLASFNKRVSLALRCGITDSLLKVDNSNFNPPVFILFDWTAFPRNLRQQYYDRLKIDFPGEFIYISASDDFTNLQGT